MTYDDHLKHLISLAKTPGWKAYAWERAKELANEKTGLWAGIDQKLIDSMKGSDVNTRLRPRR